MIGRNDDAKMRCLELFGRTCQDVKDVAGRQSFLVETSKFGRDQSLSRGLHRETVVGKT
jgi:hypothetical protein